MPSDGPPAGDPLEDASDSVAAEFLLAGEAGAPGGSLPPKPSGRSGMRASDRRASYECFEESPARSSSQASNLHNIAEESDNDPGMKEFLARFPGLHSDFDKFKQATKGKRLAVFLDYDGTLAPIVKDPDAAFMSEAMRESVRVVASNFPTAIISGRGRDKVLDFVKLQELYYAGSHGLDIEGPKVGMWAKELHFQPAKEFMDTITTVHNLLVDRVKDIPGANVENNKFCTSVHFRNCAKESWEQVVEVTESTVADFENLRITRGRKVLEVRPQLEWDKGKALYYLVDSLGLENDEVVSIYIGDDRTDEDAFKVLREKGLGYGILVSTVVKETAAFFTLKDPSQVEVFLGRLVELVADGAGWEGAGLALGGGGGAGAAGT